MFSLICVWINSWVNNGEAGDLRRYHSHYDVTVMPCRLLKCICIKDIAATFVFTFNHATPFTWTQEFIRWNIEYKNILLGLWNIFCRNVLPGIILTVAVSPCENCKRNDLNESRGKKRCIILTYVRVTDRPRFIWKISAFHISVHLIPSPIAFHSLHRGHGRKPKYRHIAYIRGTKSQNLNISRLVLQLSLPNPLTPMC